LRYLDVLLRDEDLPGVSELHQEGKGEGVNVVEDDLLLLLLRQVIYGSDKILMIFC
jgi:hypothetical protein